MNECAVDTNDPGRMEGFILAINHQSSFNTLSTESWSVKSFQWV